MNYSVTMQDVRSYLATLQPEDHAGTPWHDTHCLVGCTLRWKYPGESTRVGVSNEGFYVDEVHFDFAEDVFLTATTFDALAGEEYDDEPYGPPITLATLRERMPELFA